MHKCKGIKNTKKSNFLKTRYFDKDIPLNSLINEGLSAKVAYEIIHDQLLLDGNPSLNLASFVTNWMEPEAEKLILENMGKNFINVFEYPQTFKIEEKCVNIISNLFNAPSDQNPVGTSTIGSSEAIMLALLAHKWIWKQKRISEGLPYDKPNIVMGADTHTVWEKFAMYFDVELRLIPLEHDKYIIDSEDIIDKIDENTICVGTVFGTTYTGHMDNIKDINEKLLEIKKEKGWDIPIHVDAASGGFIAPFVYPNLEWDFRLEQVKTINASGHKYGLVYPSIGWLIFKDEKYLPKELVFNIDYLSGEIPNYSLNFSKNSSFIIAQYYNFLRLGKKGYTRILKNIIQNARYLSEELKKFDKFILLDENPLFPVVTFTLKDSSKYDVYDISEMLKRNEWIVPAYKLPENAEDIEILRIVVKENFDKNMINNFLENLEKIIIELDNK